MELQRATPALSQLQANAVSGQGTEEIRRASNVNDTCTLNGGERGTSLDVTVRFKCDVTRDAYTLPFEKSSAHGGGPLKSWT